jgi:hypothetical protein
MTDKDARPILASQDAPGGGHVLFKRSFRLLDNADLVSILDKNVVNAFPAGAIRPCAVNQNDIPDAMLVALGQESAAGQQE